MAQQHYVHNTPPMIIQRRPWHIFADGSLRTKLICTCLAVTIISVLSVALVIYRTTRASLMAEVAQNLQNAAANQAVAVGDMFAREIDLLQAFALSKVVQDDVAAFGKSYQGNDAAIEAEIQALDQQWKQASDADALIKTTLTNTVASELQEFRASFPQNVEVLATDQYGALVGATNRTSDYLQADEAWWQATYRNGQGAIFIGQPEYDQSSRTMSIVIGVPLREHGQQQVVGVLRTTYEIKTLSTLLTGDQVGETGSADLLLPDGQMIRNTGDMISTPPEMAAQLQAAAQPTANVLISSSGDQLVTQASVTTHVPNIAPLIHALKWNVVVQQDSAEALRPLAALWRITLYVGIGALLLATLLASAIAYILSQPIIRLTRAAQHLAAGDFARRVPVQQRDEIGQLAASFNTMAESLQARIHTEQAAQAEAHRLQQAEAEERQRLEQTVSHYLNFAQSVAAGDLTQRLQVQEQGTLGQLGHGLNSMVESLHHITKDVHQANTAIATVATEILAATTQQSASASQQSAALTQAVATILEIKTIAQQTAEQSAQVARDSQAMLDVAQHGTQAVEDTVSGMSNIKQQVTSIAETILALTEQTQAIGTITTTVSALADQSNLLALNAAIEAARAGEQGKSFAVVAQNVRELAERSKTATIQIRQILNEIQRATNAAVLVTEEGTKGVEVGSKLTSQAGAVIHRMTIDVERGAQSNVQMASAAQQQMAGMEQIGQAMGSIQTATTQALASTLQTEASAQDLHTLAQSLQKAIAAYRL